MTPWAQRPPTGLAEHPSTALPPRLCHCPPFPSVPCPAPRLRPTLWSPSPILSQSPSPCDSLSHLILPWRLLLRGIRPTQAGCLGLPPEGWFGEAFLPVPQLPAAVTGSTTCPASTFSSCLPCLLAPLQDGWPLYSQASSALGETNTNADWEEPSISYKDI